VRSLVIKAKVCWGNSSKFSMVSSYTLTNNVINSTQSIENRIFWIWLTKVQILKPFIGKEN
jgi:hypothetical protein